MLSSLNRCPIMLHLMCLLPETKRCLIHRGRAVQYEGSTLKGNQGWRMEICWLGRLWGICPRMADSHRAVLMNMFGLGFLNSVMLTADLSSLVVWVWELLVEADYLCLAQRNNSKGRSWVWIFWCDHLSDFYTNFNQQLDLIPSPSHWIFKCCQQQLKS